MTLEVKKRVLPFSFFPTTRDNRRYGLYDSLFAMSPWAVMENAIRTRVDDSKHRSEALAFLEQAQDFHNAADARVAANPLLLYYSFLNLGKALLRVLEYPASLDRASHGLSEKRLGGAGTELDDSVVEVISQRHRTNVFAELVERLGYARPADGDSYPVLELVPQVVVGHRIWREAERSNTERFVGLNEIEIVKGFGSKEVWLRLFVEKGDLDRYGITRNRLLSEGGLAGKFVEVRTADTWHSEALACFEQVSTTKYTGRPTDVIKDQIVASVRPDLWRIVTTTPASAYRKYYLHLSPPGEVRLPQIASLWVLFFYFGSIVRYRPHLFDEVVASRYGAFVTEFVSAQTEQLLYLLASEMCAREVARPAII